MAKFYTPTKISENIRETPEGFLFCLGVPIARTGIQVYGEGETPLKTKDGKVNIHRDAKEVFDPITIASFEGKSITIRHPENFVTPDNWSFLSKGVIQNVRKGTEKDDDGEESLLADLLITEAFAIQLVRNGLREVSCGYEAEYEQMGDGEGRQTKIVGNHLALVEEGRAGSSYAINDHKGKVTMSKKLGDKIKALLGRTIDEAMEEKKDDKAKDEFEKKEEKSEDAAAHDELVKMVADLAEKVGALGKPKDAAKEEEKSEDKEEEKKEEKSEDKEEEKKEDKAKDGDEDAEILERVKALEAAVSKLLESMDADEKEKGEEKSEDAEEEEEKKKHIYGDSKKTGLETTKTVETFDQFDGTKEAMTAEKMNELNAAHWARK